MMKLSNLLFVITLVITVVSCGGAEDRKVAYLEKAEKSLKAGDLEKARIELKNVLQIDPKDARAYFKLGNIFERQKEFRKSFGNYNKAAELDPDNSEYQAKIGRFYLVLVNDIEKATEKMDLVLSKDKNDINGLLLKAGVLARQDKIEEAKKVSTTLFENHPDNIENAMFLASFYLKEKEYIDAIRILEKSENLNPGNQQLLSKLVDVLFINKDYVRTEEIIKKMLDAHPDVFRNHLRLATFFQRINETDKAEEVLRAAISADEDALDRKLVLVEYINTTKGNDDAIKELESLISSNQQESSLPLALAKLQISMDNIDGATSTYTKIVEDFSEEAAGITARIQLARIFMQNKDVDSATAIIDEAAEISPNDADVNLVVAKISLYKKNYDKAIISLRTVVKDNPDNIEAYVLLAASHKAINEEEQAKEVINNAYENNRDNLKVLLPLAKYHLQNNNPDETEKVIDTYLRLDENNYEAQSIKASLLNKKKEYAEASEMAEKMISLYPDKENGYIQSIPALLADKKIDQAVSLLDQGYQKSKAIRIVKLSAELKVSAGKLDDAIAELNAIEQKDKDESVYLLLAKAYYANKDTEAAKKTLSLSIDQDETRIQSYNGLYSLYLSENNIQQAVSVLEKGFKANYGDIKLGVTLAANYEKTGNIEGAIDTYEAILTSNATNLVATNNLAALLAEHRTDSKSLDRAKELADKIKEAKQPVILDTVGWVYYKTGNYTDAITVLKSVVEAMPDIAVFNYHLGMAYYKSNDKDSAKAFLTKALAGKDDFSGRSEAEAVLKTL